VLPRYNAIRIAWCAGLPQQQQQQHQAHVVVIPQKFTGDPFNVSNFVDCLERFVKDPKVC
jgi:hypothetical protein